MHLVLLISALAPSVDAHYYAQLLQQHCAYPRLAAVIIAVESSYKPDAVHVNTNGTQDIGLMQVNTIHGHDPKRLLDPAYNVQVGCALLMRHYRPDDPYWVGRYHSKTPTLKKRYWRRIVQTWTKASKENMTDFPCCLDD